MTAEKAGKIIWRGKIRSALHGHYPYQYVLEKVGRKKYDLHLLHLKIGRVDTKRLDGLHKRFALECAKATDKDMGDVFEKRK